MSVEYLGRQVVCQHCCGRFEASDPSNAAPSPSGSGIDLLRRADELLGGSDLHRPRGVA
ncbi:MAG: hypothetical protein AB7O59_09170 [Pirellulales bacterium]